MKIAILNISIGKYDIFWKDFYLTAEMNFLPGHVKKYFVFTDNMSIYGSDLKQVCLIKQENLGWPFNTMKRFEMFERVISELKEFDYVFFINGNALFKEKLLKNFINFDKNLITIVHPGLFGTSIDKMPYERNPESNAYVRRGEGKFYVQGAFIGGKSDAFIQMVKELKFLTEEDLKKNIIAVWHDESFLNKYILNRSDVQVMGRQYLYYEEYVLPYKPVILLRNKRAYGELNQFRGMNRNSLLHINQKTKLIVRNLYHRFLITLHIEKLEENITDTGIYMDKDLNRG